MSYELDENGYLDVEKLTLEEKREIYAKFVEILNQRRVPSEIGDTELSEDFTEEELADKIESTPDELIWTDYYILNMDEAEMLKLVEGLSVDVAGPATIHGYREGNFPYTRYFFATNPPLNPERVYYSAECQCPFCDHGTTENGDCEICDGEGIWEWMN